MRQKWVEMRTWMRLAASIAIMQFSSAGAQTPAQPTPDEIIKLTHASFRKAKNLKEIESLKEWCRDNLAAFSFKERDRLMVSVVSLLRDNKLEEANAALKRMNELKELDKNLGDMSCKPDSKDEAIRRSQTTQQK
jgi:hypothetical protein